MGGAINIAEIDAAIAEAVKAKHDEINEYYDKTNKHENSVSSTGDTREKLHELQLEMHILLHKHTTLKHNLGYNVDQNDISAVARVKNEHLMAIKEEHKPITDKHKEIKEHLGIEESTTDAESPVTEGTEGEDE